MGANIPPETVGSVLKPPRVIIFTPGGSAWTYIDLYDWQPIWDGDYYEGAKQIGWQRTCNSFQLPNDLAEIAHTEWFNDAQCHWRTR